MLGRAPKIPPSRFFIHSPPQITFSGIPNCFLIGPFISTVSGSACSLASARLRWGTPQLDHSRMEEATESAPLWMRMLYTSTPSASLRERERCTWYCTAQLRDHNSVSLLLQLSPVFHPTALWTTHSCHFQELHLFYQPKPELVALLLHLTVTVYDLCGEGERERERVYI